MVTTSASTRAHSHALCLLGSTRRAIRLKVGSVPRSKAPEQVTLGAIDIDTWDDVHAPGMILDEWPTGSTSIERETLKKTAIDAILRVVREEALPSPSSLI